jgi:hypothetical protein
MRILSTLRREMVGGGYGDDGVVHRASCIVHRASCIVHRASCIVHRASCGMQSSRCRSVHYLRQSTHDSGTYTHNRLDVAGRGTRKEEEKARYEMGVPYVPFPLFPLPLSCPPLSSLLCLVTCTVCVCGVYHGT